MTTVPLPKDTLCITLDGLVLVGKQQTLSGKETIIKMKFDATIATSQLLGSHSRSATTQEGIENHISLTRRSKNKFGYEFFRLLSGVVCVLGHRPKRQRDVIPKVAGESGTKTSFGGLFPVFRPSFFTIGGKHSATHFHCFDIEIIILGIFDGKPDVLHRVLPVAGSPSALLPLPSDAVENGEASITRCMEEEQRQSPHI